MGIPTKVPIDLINPTPAASTDLNDYVDLTSTQTISGTKTFSQNIQLVTENTTTIDRSKSVSFYAPENINNRIAMVQGWITANDDNRQLNLVCLPSNGQYNSYAVIRLQTNADGTKTEKLYTSPATTDNSTQIATTAYVKSNLVNYLPLNCSSTLSGDLIFTNNNIVSGTAPSSSKYTVYIGGKDSTNKWMGWIGNEISSSNYSSMYFRAHAPGNQSNIKQIVIGVNSNGEWYTEAPTPATNDNSTKIATTAYVNNKLNSLTSNTPGDISAYNNRITNLESLTAYLDPPGTALNDVGINIKAYSSTEGGQIVLKTGNTSSYYHTIVDSYQNKFRIFQNNASANRMFQINFVDNDSSINFNGGTLENVMAKSFSNTSFYIKYYSGLLICCGWCNNVTTGTEITYQVPFINPPFLSFARWGTTNPTVPVYFSSNTATKCVVASASNITGYWQAIGYWK